MRNCIISCVIIVICSCSAGNNNAIVKQESLIVVKTPKFKPIQIKRELTDYVRELTNELASNIIHVKPDSIFATSSFVFIDSDYKHSPNFAKQIQESFSYEFHRLGQPIIEIKSTGYIRVLPEGDFALSNDFFELKHSQPIDYILMGTLTRLIDGVQVNAKLVGAKSHAIVAASQIIIPKAVIESVLKKPKKGVLTKLVTSS